MELAATRCCDGGFRFKKGLDAFLKKTEYYRLWSLVSGDGTLIQGFVLNKLQFTINYDPTKGQVPKVIKIEQNILATDLYTKPMAYFTIIVATPKM